MARDTDFKPKDIKEVYEFRWVHVPIYLILTVGAIISLMPFLYMVSTSLMTLGETIIKRLIPKVPQWSNYAEAWNEANFSLFFFNSVLITAVTIVGLLFTSILAGYAFARIEFPGRNALFMILLATLMIPGTVTFIPNLLMIRGEIIPFESFLPSHLTLNDTLGQITVQPDDPTTELNEQQKLIDTQGYAGIRSFDDSISQFELSWIHKKIIDFLKVYGLNALSSLTLPFMASAFSIFLLRQFFIGIPRELWDAAQIDGAGHVTFLRTVVLPMSRPVIMTVTLLTFVSSWNEFIWPLLVTTSPTWRPLGVGLYTFISEAGPETHLIMAGAVITIIPVLVVYFITQKQFTEGIATSGLKG